MARLQELGLTQERVGTEDFDKMPKQRTSGDFTPLPPGPYRFRLPKLTVDMDVWDQRQTERGARLVVKMTDTAALLVVQSPGGAHDGETYNWTVSNQEFNRARRGEPEQMASDLDFLFRDAFKIAKRPQNNPGYAQQLMALAGKEFTADVEWSWYCNDEKNIRVPDGQGGYTEIEQKGCGTKFFQGGKNGVQKAPADPSQPVGPNNPLVWPERIGPCPGKDGVPCGASIRAFPNLRNLRP